MMLLYQCKPMPGYQQKCRRMMIALALLESTCAQLVARFLWLLMMEMVAEKGKPEPEEVP